MKKLNQKRIQKQVFKHTPVLLDSIILPLRNIIKAPQKAAPAVRKAIRIVLASPALLILILSSLVIPLSAFEAHVINVTATIENRPFCEARSIGYWRNHEGCERGEGFSQWRAEINDLSATFSNVFASYTGQQICSQLWVPNCPGGNTLDSRLCKAKAHTLADELNVVSNRLQLRALLAGADDGSAAFDNLGLASSSKIEEALSVIEAILASSTSTSEQINNADYIAERIYAFYEEENPIAPLCVFNLSSLPTSNTNVESVSSEPDEESNTFLQSSNAALISSTGELNEVYEEPNEQQSEPEKESGVTVEISPEVEIITETSTTSSETIENEETTTTSQEVIEPEPTPTESESQGEEPEPSPTEATPTETQIESAP